MAKKKIAIDNVEIDIAGKKLKLSIDQAMELRDILDETFPKYSPVSPVYIPYYVERYREYRPHWTDWEITWEPTITISGGVTYDSNTMYLSSSSV